MDTSNAKQNNITKELAAKRDLPLDKTLRRVIHRLSPSERLLWWLLATALLVSTLAVLAHLRAETTTQVPARGGTLHEGVIGAPRFINPLLALSDTDRDLTQLLFTGLTRVAPDGGLVPDLAERFNISEDGTEYHFVLRDDARFHDGTPVTVDDVIFTIGAVQDPTLKSPKRADWDGVIVEKINDRELVFVLSRPYAPFIENTTLGILPRHLWIEISPQEFVFSNLNTQPVGAGPFVVKDIQFDNSGIPSLYELESYEHYTQGEPFIDRIFLYFYANEEELVDSYRAGTIDIISAVSAGVLDDALTRSEILRITFPRIFAVFFNQNKNRAFADKAVRKALDQLLNKEQIIQEVLGGYGAVIESPVPPSGIRNAVTQAEVSQDTVERNRRARETLEGGGWGLNEETNQWENGDGEILAFTLATANTPELKSAAQIVARQWTQAGIPVKVNVFEIGDLNQNVIRPRDYEGLLFGEVVGRGSDLFAFWHSSQRDDPGLNIALYTNATADKILSETRAVSDPDERDELYKKFEEEIRDDVPAVFLYTPDFLYITPENLLGDDITFVTTPSERFGNVYEWHKNTQRVWHFFSDSYDGRY